MANSNKIISALRKAKIIESSPERSKSHANSVSQELLNKSAEDFWAQITATQGQEHHGKRKEKKTEKKTEHKEQKSVGTSIVDMLLGQEYSLAGQASHAESSEKHEEAPKYIEPGISYHRDIVKSSENSNRRQLSEMERRFEQIHDELKRLVDSSNKIVQDEFGGMALDSAPKEVGKYHINFLDWMLIAIKTTREKVEDSGAWLAAMKSKKGKKGYWGMFKQHGTSFGMSNERQVATQTG